MVQLMSILIIKDEWIFLDNGYHDHSPYLQFRGILYFSFLQVDLSIYIL